MPIFNAFTFNPAGLIGDAVGSAQGDARVEVVAVDGVPADGTGVAVEGLDERDRLARAERNGGQGTAGRAGLGALGSKWAASPGARDRHQLRRPGALRMRLRTVPCTLIQGKQRKHA